MSTEHLRGMGVALTTPFKENGDIDYPTLDVHLDYLIDSRTDYIVVLGTTAEAPTLTSKEKDELTRHIVEYVDRRCPLVLGVGGNSTHQVVSELTENEIIKDFDAILSVVPYYNKPTQEGLYRHFSEIAKASPVPVILYNIPGRTGINMDADTIIRLAKDHPDKIIGVKEASGNMEQASDLINRRPAGFLVISGDDSLAHSIIRAGGDGVISVIGNAYPSQFSTMIHKSLEDETPEAAAKLHQQFSALYTLLFKDGNPAGIKALLHLLFPRYKEVLRLPLVEVTEETRSALESELI